MFLVSFIFLGVLKVYGLSDFNGTLGVWVSIEIKLTEIVIMRIKVLTEKNCNRVTEYDQSQEEALSTVWLKQTNKQIT